MIDKLITPALRTPKLVLALIAIAFVVCGAIGTRAAARLSNGGFVSTHSESDLALAEAPVAAAAGTGRAAGMSADAIVQT
ncbi:hypothetical protein ACFV4K_05860 [Nocardia sp. NPDC059764]|uniref:hypothetical protein n=1 Tax=Nocardia sp. NPDC059764 TaxID=3346939 RepID=UPI00364FB1B0